MKDKNETAEVEDITRESEKSKIQWMLDGHQWCCYGRLQDNCKPF